MCLHGIFLSTFDGFVDLGWGSLLLLLPDFLADESGAFRSGNISIYTGQVVQCQLLFHV